MAAELLAWRQRGGPAADVDEVPVELAAVAVEAVEAVSVDPTQAPQEARGGAIDTDGQNIDQAAERGGEGQN